LGFAIFVPERVRCGAQPEMQWAERDCEMSRGSKVGGLGLHRFLEKLG
jgi:hypothetical protein